jgi:uncharacterized protein (TIGR03435 family)
MAAATPLRAALLVAIVAALPTAHAQSASRFEVASVRTNRRLACSGPWDLSATHGKVNAANAPLLRIISRAFNLTDDRVSGPAWLDSQCYDIIAKARSGTPDSDLMPMLRTLLAERFHLVARLQPEERTVSVLVVDKGGSKLRPYGDDTGAPPSNTGGRILFMARHLPDLCERLGKVTGRPVIDKTGLTGDYMIVLSYLPLGSYNPDPSDPATDIVSAVRDQLGLHLESQRAVVDVLKIESVEKVPTRN